MAVACASPAGMIGGLWRGLEWCIEQIVDDLLTMAAPHVLFPPAPGG